MSQRYCHLTAKQKKVREKEIRKHEAENIQKFKWPDTILWKDTEVLATNKFPNWAEYMLGPSQMNRVITLTKLQYFKSLKNEEKQKLKEEEADYNEQKRYKTKQPNKSKPSQQGCLVSMFWQMLMLFLSYY